MINDNKYLSVTAFNTYIKRKFDVDPYLGQVFITGEISNFRLRPKHQYFVLKDDHSKMDVVMWQSVFAKLPFKLEDGMKVNVRGRISVFQKTGTYQLYVDKMEPDGIGALYQAYEQLKNKLASEGLFDPQYKKPLPMLPKRIAVITSESGAVIKDIITTTRRRFPIAQLVLFPAIVQGDQAADDIVRQIERVNQLGNFDTLIVGRGGGSIEDLWPFNEERVARAIFESRIPVISSVGHETDTTIADFVADQRAATPTAAAEMAVPKLSDVLFSLQNAHERIFNAFHNYLARNQQWLNNIKGSYVFRQPERLYESYVQQLDNLRDRLNNGFQNQLNLDRQRLEKLNYNLRYQSPIRLVQAQNNQLNLLNQRMKAAVYNRFNDKQNQFKKLVNTLEHLSPLKIMGRGYSYVSKDTHVIQRVSDLKVNDQITLGFIDGNATAEIKQIQAKEQD
ncbi:exodeoxyribonuclease VII large subunit [Nicoliella spurrieriana]|uniref:Exodeoxyribonuclease 7 large subunit n=1 Tax=Nicoliella spurrieriana TaxID=2925830 RepID=A0A976RRP1_9LACO|nr:exodeoxyribonuclease VII large subunit [Nicoliella spurrieriana]UQS86652.1 exodeoxyribonuclease VII large subunit [Nicoliella spurrieriana]